MKIFGLISLTLIFFAVIANAQWTKQNVDTKASFRGLSVVSEKIIWASGTGGTVIKTTDGGKNWSVMKVPDADKLDFRDIEAFDAETAYILSIGEGESSRIYKTTDGGKTWKMQFKNTNPKAFFDAIAFWDKTHGIAMSDPVDGKFLLYITEDGETWKILSPKGIILKDSDKEIRVISNMHGPPAYLDAFAMEGTAAFAASGTCIITRGKSEVYLVTGGSAANVFSSYNRGQSWHFANSPIISGMPSTGIFSIAMRDSRNGVIVGGNYEKPNEINNNLAFTTDGGKTWNLSKGLNGYRSGVAYIDKKTIIAVGSSGSDISNDGGKSWKNLDKENYNAVTSKGKKAIWAVGANGLVSKFEMK